MDKTNAARRLEGHGISHTVTVYDAARAFHSADEAAALLGAPAACVFKTLVVLREGAARGKPLLVLVPSDGQLDPKRLARELGEKKVRMATQREAEALTGLQVGGISALAVRPGAFEVLLDASARAQARIHVSAGVRGVDIELGVDDLVRITRARVVGATASRGTAGEMAAGGAPAAGGTAAPGPTVARETTAAAGRTAARTARVPPAEPRA
jgi:Cys-tRNA(Pro)/Cys-tRNA(Cys) deacylase